MATPKLGRKIYEEHMAQNSVVVEEKVITEQDTSAEVLMDYLPDDAQLLIREAAQHMNVPVWQMLLGYVMRCHDGALMYSPYLLSSWETGGKPNKPRPCKGCGLSFSSRFPDAAYCCNACAFGKLDIFGHVEECPAIKGTVQ